jgi:hypothetical protein
VQSREHLFAKMGKWKRIFVHEVMDLLAVRAALSVSGLLRCGLATELTRLLAVALVDAGGPVQEVL